LISKFINNLSGNISGAISGQKKSDKRANEDGIIIELKDVWKTYVMGEVKVHALRGLNLRVKKGEFLAVMGPSGSGKSTFMNMVGCLDIPSRGSIFLDGKDISLMSESDLAQIRGRKIGFIFQKFNLLNTMTAKENVMLPLTFQGLSQGERESTSKKYLQLVGLGERMDHTPNELSGGQQQRVAIARALANNPEVILADEPTGNLDSHSGKSVLDFLRKLHEEQGTTIIMVTHDDKIAKQADRIAYLKDGMIVQSLDVDTSKMKEFNETGSSQSSEKKKK
jgi:putative ABC transport system ATP-binding protein